MPQPLTRVRLMTYNIRLGLDGPDLASLAAAVRAAGVPDLLALQEIGVGWRMGEPVDQPAVLAAALDLPYHAFAGALTDDAGGRFGVALLSRWPLCAVDVSLLPLEVDEQRVALRVAVDTEPRLWIVNTHLSIRAPERLRQAERVGRLFAECPGPRVLMGDLNDTPDGPALAALAAHGGGVDLFDAGGEGPPLTFSVKQPNRRIDYLRCAGGLVPSGPARVLTDVRTSDHFPLVGAVEHVPPS